MKDDTILAEMRAWLARLDTALVKHPDNPAIQETQGLVARAVAYMEG
jgi:hypothetical protein